MHSELFYSVSYNPELELFFDQIIADLTMMGPSRLGPCPFGLPHPFSHSYSLASQVLKGSSCLFFWTSPEINLFFKDP